MVDEAGSSRDHIMRLNQRQNVLVHRPAYRACKVGVEVDLPGRRKTATLTNPFHAKVAERARRPSRSWRPSNTESTMSDQPSESNRPSRRSIVRGTLIGLGAALLVQPNGGAGDAAASHAKKGKRKRQKKEETPKKEGS